MSLSTTGQESNQSRRAGLFRIGLTEIGRLEAFSDGVFAVAVTLLVLDLHLPSPEPSEVQLWTALARLLPSFVSWAISFAFLLVVWVNHHYLFSLIKHTDRGLMWLNGVLLFGVSFVPFPTSVAGHYFLAPAGLVLTSVAMFVVSASFSAMRWYAGFVAELTHEEITREARSRALRRSLVGPVLYLAAALLAFRWPVCSLLIQVLVPVMFFLRSPSHAHPQTRHPPPTRDGQGTA